MSDNLPSYSFLPWLRQGLSNNISQGDADNTVLFRASIPISITVSATPVDSDTAVEQPPIPRTIELYGPGDIVGIDSRMIIKTEPRNWITNFEPNYFPYVEFYEEDFPWRYTPAFPDASTDRLRPWITLVVLKEDEFEDGANIKDKPLPFFKMKDGKKPADIFPVPAELWAWAHVHVNSDLSKGVAAGSSLPGVITTEITNLISSDPDKAYSRIICPRKLEPNIAYHAFLIPTFESGRLSGLGRVDNNIMATLVATKSAWEDEANIEFPYYYRWYFRTGNVGDFEYLVSLLEAKPADKQVGVRDIDVIHPGSGLPPIADVELNGVLKLGGALRVPFDSMKEEDKPGVIKYEQWDENPYPHDFSKAIAKRINLADDYVDANKTIEEVNSDAGIISEEGIIHETNAGDPDPIITSPLYARWHALQQRLLKDKDSSDLPDNKNWVHELNLDPRYRVAAGLGTKVIQKGQEEYMHAAWEQVGKITETNNKIRFSQVALEVTSAFYFNHVVPLSTEKVFLFTSPLQKRITTDAPASSNKRVTVHKVVQQSTIPFAVTTGTFRNITRPHGAIMKKMIFDNTRNITSGNLIERINNEQVIIAPPKIDPPGAINLNSLADNLRPKDVPGFIEELLKKNKWFKFLPLIVLFLLMLLFLLFFATVIGAIVLAPIAAGLVWGFNKLNNWAKSLNSAAAVSQAGQVPGAIDEYPKSPDFKISTPGSGFTPSYGTADNEIAKSFKTALKDVFTIVNISFPEQVRTRIDLGRISDNIVKSVNPELTIKKRIRDVVKIPERIVENMTQDFAPVMIHPEIDIPMYKPLADISAELFLPNINLIEQNSITLLENNQKFIESYMVGINHEMSRELLWREYPTDQRGTYFRQFWDVSGFLSPNPVPDNIKETLRDIPPIHTWSKTDTANINAGDPNSPLKNELGQHNQRALAGGKTQLVLVIRGELLKKYPTAVVYAHKADWGINKLTDAKDINVERVFVELTDIEKQNPPADKLKTPLFEAKVEPDIYFFGFDLDDEEVRGTMNPASSNDDPGWFFVIKERPGEPRFGLDINKTKLEDGTTVFINWNQLSWEHLSTANGQCIKLDQTIEVNPTDAISIGEYNASTDDVQAEWSPSTNAAEIAYILYQVPVLVGVHASRMLPK